VSDLRAIGDDVRRLGRVPEVDPLVVTARRVWRDAVGDQVAAHSLPVRRSSAALVVHCVSSGWVSELTLLERHVRSRLEQALGQPAPPLRFVVGDVEAPDQAPLPAGREPAPEPTDQQRMQAAELASSIADAALRNAAERAIASSLARDS
jgi:predicted nucleic acid-binding Zn ribbon protein